MEIVRALTSPLDTTSDNARKNLNLSASVAAVDGISETLSWVHSKALDLYARVNDSTA